MNNKSKIMQNKKFSLSIRQKKSLTGYLFIMPFIVGFLLFVFFPLLQSIIYSFMEIQVSQGEGFLMSFVGFENYNYALRVNPEFSQILIETFRQTLLMLPQILILSFFLASLLNQKFRGRSVVRLIFFLPVVLSAEIIHQIEATDYLSTLMQQYGEGDRFSFVSYAVFKVINDLVLPLSAKNFLFTFIASFVTTLTRCGIPMLIFLAGLQSIPESFYEEARIEGATKWEYFWKIIFPLMTPMFVTNTVFIIIGSFTGFGNEVVSFISNTAWAGAGYGPSVAMSWLYFIGISVILMGTAGIISRKAIYLDY